MLKKLFGGIKLTWPRLIIASVAAGIITGLIALFVPNNTSIHQIAVTFEFWIVAAIVAVVNCDRPLEAACKTFVFFLISQPLVYLVQAPFNSLGMGLFRYYYPYWFYWTLATFPGAFVAWYIKKDNLPAALILSVALAMLIYFGSGYLKDLLRTPPRYLLSTVFCFGAVPLLILCILHKRNPRLIAAGIAAVALAGCLFLQFRGGTDSTYGVSFGLDQEKYPVTEEWTVRLDDPGNGSAALSIGDEVIGSSITVTIVDPNKSADVILISPDGTKYLLPATVVRDGNGAPSFVY